MADEEEKFVKVTVEELAELLKRIPVRMAAVLRRGSSSSTTNNEDLFAEAKEALKNPIFERPVDCCWRKIMRFNFDAKIYEFGFHPSLLHKNRALLQIVLKDENRHIQEKMFYCPSTIDVDDPDVAKHSREMFKAASPNLLNDTANWVFCRFLVMKDYNGMKDKALKFTSHDPIGGLDVIADLPIVTPRNPSRYQRDCIMQNLTIDAMEKFRTVPEIPHAIRCAEIFMLLVGEFFVGEEGLNSREAVQKLLHDLNTEEGILKLHGCYVLCGSSKMSPENLAALEDVHETA